MSLFFLLLGQVFNYDKLQEKKSWNMAHLFCRELGAQLLSLGSYEEEHFVADTLNKIFGWGVSYKTGEGWLSSTYIHVPSCTSKCFFCISALVSVHCLYAHRDECHHDCFYSESAHFLTCWCASPWPTNNKAHFLKRQERSWSRFPHRLDIKSVLRHLLRVRGEKKPQTNGSATKCSCFLGRGIDSHVFIFPQSSSSSSPHSKSTLK